MLTCGDGGAGWADLGFTSPLDGAVIHAPAPLTNIGQLLLTGDGGRTWHPTSFTGYPAQPAGCYPRVRGQLSRFTHRDAFTRTEAR